MKIEEKLAARAAESPVTRALRRHGLEECEACRSWHRSTRGAREFHENRCGGATYAKED